MQQLQIIEENETMVKQRERDVLHIARSIVELNQLFKGVFFPSNKAHNDLQMWPHSSLNKALFSIASTTTSNRLMCASRRRLKPFKRQNGVV